MLEESLLLLYESTLQSPVLFLEVSTHKGLCYTWRCLHHPLKLHLDLSTLQRCVQHREVTTSGCVYNTESCAAAGGIYTAGVSTASVLEVSTPRGCTYTWLDNRSLWCSWTFLLYTTGAWAAPGHIQTTVACLASCSLCFLAVLQISDVLMWIQILGSIPLTNGSGPCNTAFCINSVRFAFAFFLGMHRFALLCKIRS